MKILILSWRDIKHPWAGGSEVNLHEMAKYWVKWGHEVTLLCAKGYDGGQASSHDVIDGVNIIRVGGRYSLYILAALYYLVKLRRKYDFIVDVENGIPFFTPLFTRTSKCCLVNHVHKEVFFTELRFPLNWIGYLIEIWVFPFIYKRIPIVAVSNTTKGDLVSIGLIPKDIKVIHPGVHYHGLTAAGIKFDLPTIIYLGRLRKYKRVRLLLDVFFEVKKTVNSARLVIAGDGDDKSELEQIIKNAVYRDDIKLLGYVSEKEKIRLLQRAWVYVTPSTREGWGLAVLEANACGTPAIAFRVPGLSESIHNHRSGFLVETVAEMIEKIVLVLSDEKLRKRISAGALEQARSFRWDRSSQAYLNLFSEIRDGKYSRTYFSGFWRNYRGRKFHPLNNFRTWYILRKLKPKRVLDVGCGMGLLVESLHKRGIDVHGIDISSYALSSVPGDLRSKCSLGNITSLDFPDESFDVVVSVDVLEHLSQKEIQKAVKECLRVARNRVYFEITVREDLIFVNKDPTHISKYPAKWWFDELVRVGSKSGWKIKRGPTIPILRYGIFVAEKLKKND